MKKQDIDNIFNYINVGDIESFLELVQDRETAESIRQMMIAGDDNQEKIQSELAKCCKDIVAQMKENSLYEYFEEKGLTDENKNSFLEIVTRIKISKDEAERYIENDKVPLYLGDKINLVKATKDNEYIKEYFERLPEFATHSKIDLLKELGSTELIKKYILDSGYTLSRDQKTELIAATGDKTYILDCLDSPDYYFNDNQQVELLTSLGDQGRIEAFLSEKKESLTPNEKKRLIKATGNPEYIKSCIEDKTLGLLADKQVDLIKAIGDPEYIKYKLKDKTLELDEEQQVDLIKATGDLEYAKECLVDESLGLNTKQKADIIKSSGDIEYIKSCIKDDSLGLDSNAKAVLIKATGDPEYIKSCIDDDSIGLEKKSKIDLTLASRDKDYIKGTIGEYIDAEPKKKIKLPEGMTIGVEIEADDYSFRGDVIDDWKAKGDGSVPRGSEFISPILTGSEQDSSNIYAICNMLKELGGNATDRCGGHVHIGANHLKSKQAYTNLVELWGNSEQLLYTISNKKGEITREGGAGHYAVPLSKKIEEALESGTINLEDEGDLGEFVSGIIGAQADRYSGLNFMNMAEGGKKTIEFRLANGTIDPDTWIENINLFGGVIAASERLAQIQEKSEEQRTDEENQLLAEFNRLKTPDVTEKEKLEALLKLTIPEEDREIYEARYETNKKLLDEHESVKDAIQGKLSTEPLDFKGKKSKTLKSAIDATEQKTTSGEIAECQYSLDLPQMERKSDLDI